MNIMRSKTTLLLPKNQKTLQHLGENIKLARLRRKLTAEQVSERAGVSRATLWAVEKGAATVAIGTYLQVLVVLGLEKDFLKVANDDELGRKLQDSNLLIRKRGPRRPKDSE